jgi:hypothetical protein
MIKPEEMTDEQLVEPRDIATCVEVGDGTWEAVLSCGHEVVMVVTPEAMTLPGCAMCAQCVDILLERRKKDPGERP